MMTGNIDAVRQMQVRGGSRRLPCPLRRCSLPCAPAQLACNCDAHLPQTAHKCDRRSREPVDRTSVARCAAHSAGAAQPREEAAVEAAVLFLSGVEVAR